MTGTRRHRTRAARARAFGADEGGATTVWLVFWAVVFMLLGGVAVDSAKAWRMEAALQAAADAAAHAALVALAANQDEKVAREAALTFARANLAESDFGEVLSPESIEFGAWDEESGGFARLEDLPEDRRPGHHDEDDDEDKDDEEEVSPYDAVRVTLVRASENGNAEPATFLRLAGLQGWDIAVQSVVRIVRAEPPDIPECWENGLVARGTLSATSNNEFKDVCLHGEAGVSFQSGNTFDDGVEVSMPDLSLLSVPGGRVRSNPGLDDALKEKPGDPWVVDYIDELVETMRVADGAETVPAGAFDATLLFPGDARFVNCSLGGVLSIPAGTTLDRVTILTDCAVSFGANVTLIDTIIATNGDAAASASSTMQAAAGLTIGRAGDCGGGGASQILVDGDFKSAAGLEINGSQIIASGDVTLAAQAEGVNGATVLSGGDIDLSAGNSFGDCDKVGVEVPTPESLSRTALALAR